WDLLARWPLALLLFRSKRQLADLEDAGRRGACGPNHAEGWLVRPGIVGWPQPLLRGREQTRNLARIRGGWRGDAGRPRFRRLERLEAVPDRGLLRQLSRP